MTTLTVGDGQPFSTIAAAVNASQSGDTIDVQAGVYTNDFTTISHDLILQAVGGMVTMAATVQPPNGKAILDEGGSGVSVAIDGFSFTGAAVNDGNGAGIRYEGGSLTLTNSDFHGNQDGILGTADPNGVISIANSQFHDSGTGDGQTHNIYIGAIRSFTLSGSFVHDESVGNQVKSRAANNAITNNRIFDNTSTASYEIDLPNGGNALISGNVIQQGSNSQNYNIISYGEEGGAPAGATLSVSGNTILNDLGRGPALVNATGVVATFANNAVYGFGAGSLVNGPAIQSGTTVLATEPPLDQSAPYSASPPTAPPVATMPAPSPAPMPMPVPMPVPAPVSSPAPQPVTIGSGPDSLVVTTSEDYYLGDAQFTLAIDGAQAGGVQTTTAVRSAGQTQAFTVLGNFGSGPHALAVTFTNDASNLPYGDRNLYVDSIGYDGVLQSSSVTTILGYGAGTVQTDTFAIAGAAPAPPPAPTPAAGLVLNVSEDAWQGDAQFVFTEDGRQVGGVRTATALHASGDTQAITLGQLSAGPHAIGVSFINDAYGGTPGTDRNLYVDGASYNGQAIAGSAATLLGNGTASFAATGEVTSASGVLINVAEDAWMGDTQFTLSVDGAQVGGVHTATAPNASGQSQAFGLDAALGAGPHTVGVTFINDAYGGTPSTDRNLYVTGATLNGQAVSGSAAALLFNSTHDFTVVIPG